MKLNLNENAKHFAAGFGKLAIVDEELKWKPDYSRNEIEWLEMQRFDKPLCYTLNTKPVHYENSEFIAQFEDQQLQLSLQPVRAERHIGIDQGEKNFAIVVVDKVTDQIPLVMAANVYNLNLPKRFNVNDVVIALQRETNLLSWMQATIENVLSNTVDRVIVHVEQISIHNKNSKQFGIELSKSLQRFASDLNKCVIKMSQPHLLRASGPAFKLGTNIVKELNLKPVFYHYHQPSIFAPSRKRNSDGQSVNQVDPASDYKHRKNMSANIFKYVILANNEQLEDMKLGISDNVRQEWRRKLADTEGKAKTDDVGDALLHALNDILCGNSNFRQLVPSAPSLYNNRTVAISVFLDKVYWVVLLCSWNSFLVEDLGAYNFLSRNTRQRMLYRSLETVDKIIKCST